MSGQSECSSEMLGAGAMDFLHKPIALTDLKNVIERHRAAMSQAQLKPKPTQASNKPVQQRNGTRAHLTDAPRTWMREQQREQRRRQFLS